MGALSGPGQARRPPSLSLASLGPQPSQRHLPECEGVVFTSFPAAVVYKTGRAMGAARRAGLPEYLLFVYIHRHRDYNTCLFISSIILSRSYKIEFYAYYNIFYLNKIIVRQSR